MIAPHFEPIGLKPDAVPIAAYMEAGCARDDAIRGSRRLLKAILGLQRPPRRQRPGKGMGSRSWAVRKVAIQRTKDLIETAARYYGVRPEDFTGKRGSLELSLRRQVVMYVAREEFHASFPDIGYCLKRDHTTVIHGCRVAELDPGAKQDIAALRKAVAQ